MIFTSRCLRLQSHDCVVTGSEVPFCLHGSLRNSSKKGSALPQIPIKETSFFFNWTTFRGADSWIFDGSVVVPSMRSRVPRGSRRC